MAEGSSTYRVMLEAIIKQIQQSQVDSAARGLKPITIAVNLSTQSAKTQIEEIKKMISVAPGDIVSTKTTLNAEGLKQYQVGVEHVASGMKTVSNYIADINKKGEISVKQIDSVKSATYQMSKMEKKQ